MGRIESLKISKKRRLVLIVGILLISISISAQPPETTYLGNAAVSGYADDESYGPYNIGFNFTFYGNTYNQFYINSNGQLLFGAGSFLSSAKAIPTADEPNNFIAPFWDDLVVDSYGKILYTTIGAAPNRKLIVQFTNMGFYPFPANLGTFSVILYETTNRIQVQYRVIVLSSSAKAHGGQAAIGLENETGSAGVQYAFLNPSAVNSEQAISFSPVAGPSYSVNPGAVYDGVYLTTNLTLPEPGITTLISPPLDAAIGSSYTFEWGSASNAASYTLYLSTDPELIGAVAYPAGSNLTYNISGLTLNQTYYWGVFSKNATGTTWCEIKKFTTSSAPPLVPVPQTVWTEQFTDKTIKLNYTGGNTSPKAAVITSIPAQGQLYQYNSGVRGSLISLVPTTVSDAGMNVIYAATGSSTGNGVGNFRFRINDSGGNSTEGTITVNVSPPGVPEVLYIAKGTDNIEIQFDQLMANPSGKESQFTVSVNSTPVTVNSVNLKEGDNYTIVLNLGVTLSGSETLLVSYTQGDVTGATGGFLFSFADEPVNLTSQTITFTQSLVRKFNESPFALSSSASSGLMMTYSSSNLSVATIIGTIATFNSIGSSVITARQAGNATYAPAKYIRTLTVEKGDQTITFNALPVKVTGDPDFSPGATVTSGLPVSYTSSNPSVATIVSGMIHIVATGTSVITALQSGNATYNAATSVPQILTVTGVVTEKTLNLTSVLLEGLYNGSGTMRQAWNESGPMWPAGVADHITVELHSGTNYSLIIYTATDVPLGITGSTTLSIPAIYNGNYYITIRHRNSIETTTAAPVSFSAGSISYSFGSQPLVYGYNLQTSFDGRFLIYGGDVNQDGFVDSGDYPLVVNGNNNYASGYLSSDIDGSGYIDSGDFPIMINNNYNYIGTIHP